MPHFPGTSIVEDDDSSRYQEHITALEKKNKMLFDTYSSNEKKLLHVLRKVKDENQSLLRNLKKLLGKPVISTRVLLSNPAYRKFLQKLKELKQTNQDDQIFQNKRSEKQDFKRSLSEDAGTGDLPKKAENSFVLSSLRKRDSERIWMTALHYSTIQ